ncbi:SUMF1/EgtB/PvdO family nonheme iron enzyme [Dictyobacter aurantiacus]|uniref:Sulfatase-modifying factor enzyme-like domain-containing protein n=1 Tax=Dictyobacter aurantiacus TaxID=1936993 RepID=A0A401Z745_9CHLR|nr:SUMF1/EgtB/PvdO family nonheme iron enzyme [Dictyobacter aurantiacus]GCE02674.1 hypothetical protein KDAU_00030 [Dictyobacter aurantiacus]GCE07773.1 hypothetical protein KDAU_51020 [Dictyobacter aurantiacus]GCE07778.1 hypothetical protein KDAU_51070 [Dictyobacter aurantiacus]GCE10139.1 hypothetical protein KDAU_74680 [Dictyobacter aurantiacus]
MDQEMARVLQEVALWDACSLTDCEAVAHAVEQRLPSLWELMGVETYEVGGQRHAIALFAWRPPSTSSAVTYALLPGGTVTLGYDRRAPLAPDKELVRDWWDTRMLSLHGERVTLDGALVREIIPMGENALAAELAEHLLPLRTVTLAPFLLETIAQEAEQVLPAPVLTYERYRWKGKDSCYFTRSIHRALPHRHVVAFLKQQGCRLPSADEWEYACAAGARSLFYWGDGPFASGEDRPVDPPAHNAFGVRIVTDSYRWEYCQDPSMMRGGDGGALACSGEGVLASSLPHASAYACRLTDKQVNNGVFGPCFRRVFDLPFPLA